MRISFTILFLLVASIITHAQERLISGVLKSADGSEPLPGVSIQIKGTTTGTTTDAEGRYSIRVPVGATLVFSFIGMETREVVVTGEGIKPQKNGVSKQKRLNKPADASIPRALLSDTTSNVEGVTTLTDESPTYMGQLPTSTQWIAGFRRLGNRFQILTYADLYKATGYSLQFTTTIGVDHVTQLPALQSSFAQGRPDGTSNTWRGAHQSEIFSWGPQLKTLEYDGQPYVYDKNGMLVQAGTGNGNQANSYHSNVFRTGITNANDLTISLPGPSHSTILFDVESRIRSGVIQNSSYKKFNAGLSIKDLVLKKLRANGTLSFNDSRGTLLPHGANLSAIIGAAYRTPVTFDNLNGESQRKANSSSTAYRLEDGNIRSHAPGLADNPFGLINELPDKDHLQRLIGLIDTKYNVSDDISINVNANTDRQSGKNVYGIPADYSGSHGGRITERQDLQWLSSIIISPTFTPDPDDRITLGVAWQVSHDYRELKRADGFNLNEMNLNNAGLLVHTGNELSRSTHELSAKAEYHDYWLKFKVNGRSYFSNTASSKHYAKLLPSASVSLDFVEVAYIEPINTLRAHVSFAQTVREAPLLYTQWSYLSIGKNAEQYNSYYEDRELYFNNDLIPESERKFEAGVSAGLSRLTVDFAYFNNYTQDFVAPVSDGGNYVLKNAATIKNYGSTISVDYYAYVPNAYLTTQLRWTKSYSRALDVYGSNRLPLAGFSTIQTVLASGEPVGAIYGTTFQRNAEGKTIIGADGFPLEDLQLKKIGDPIPDWVLGWSVQFNTRGFGASFLFDFKRGGDVWNGTQAALDYLGRSATTGDLRNTAGYVFDGVNENNLPNTTPVSFADPGQPLTANRWVRYGWDGVGESYIEDGSWIRLSELNFSYSINRPSDKKIKEIKFNIVGRNLFLITPYSGVDPSSALFGYSSGSALDLFNMPSIRSYNFQVTVKI